MEYTFSNTDPQEFVIIPGKTYQVEANDGDLTIEKKKLDGAWVSVFNGPLADGEQKILRTHSDGAKIRVTASAAGTEFIMLS
jgi:hypothetical protein